MTEEQKNHKDMIIDFDELWLDELIEEDLKKEKKKSELSDEMKKKLDQQDLNKFWDALEKSTFQQKISSTNNKEWSFISDLITNTSNLQKEQKENSTLDQQNKINKQIEQHNTHTNTEQHFQDVKQTHNNTTVNNNNTTIIQEQQQSKTNEQQQQNTTIQQNITNIENNQNTQNNNQNNNTQNIEDKKEDKQWNETKEDTIKESVKEVIIQNNEKETNTTTNNNTNTNEIWTAIEEKREKIEWWSEINVKPTWAYSKEVADNSALFTQEKELQQLQENKQIQNKIDKEWNEIKKEDNTENNVTVKIETPTTQQPTPTQTPSQQQTSEIWNDKIQQELEEKKEQEQNKEDTHSIQDVMNNEKKQDLPKQQETKKENREEKIEQNKDEKKDEDLWKSKVQTNIWKWRKIAVNTLDDLSNIEETIEKEKNRLWKKWEYTNKDLENIKRTMWEWSQFTKLIDWIDKKIVWWPLSNELRDKYIEESTQWQLFWNLEEVKREYEKRQTKERWNFVMKKISWIEDTNINEYQMYETIAKFTWFLNFSLSQTLVRIFTWWYAFLVIIYTTLWVLSIKWWFTIPWMWAWLWWLLFWWILIFVLSKFSLDAKKS